MYSKVGPTNSHHKDEHQNTYRWQNRRRFLGLHGLEFGPQFAESRTVTHGFIIAHMVQIEYMRRTRLWLILGIILVITAVVTATRYAFPGLTVWVTNQVFNVTSSRQAQPDLPVVSVIDPEPSANSGEAADGEVQATPVAEPVMAVVAENLEIPWEIAFLPDGSLLVTERPGRIVRIMASERKTITVEGVAHVGEGGLLGLALDPQYQNNHLLYVYHTTREGGGLTNRVEQYYFDETSNVLSQKKVILADIPAAGNHDGGRIAFGPDDRLYITTGDAQNESSARDQSALSGKILRMDNGPIVYSYGHRNPQGLSWDARGNLWSTEHGRSGAVSGLDEVNLIGFGNDYGWPEFQGDQSGDGITPPVLHSGSSKTWAPADVQVVGEHLLWSGLRGQAVYSAKINGTTLSDQKEHFTDQFGRIRVVRLSLDERWIYLATSNRDGRGSVKPGDDTIVRINTKWFIENNL